MSILTDADPITFVLTTDRERARRFYTEVVGLPLVEEDSFAMMFRLGGGALLRIADMASHTAQPSTVLGWSVPDIRATMAELTAMGVTFTIYEGFGQDGDGVWTAPGGQVQIAWFTDPDGNVLSLTQF